MPEASKTPAFGDLLARGQEALTQLATLGQALARDLEARQAELAQSLARQRQLEQDLDAFRAAQQSWTAERQRLLTEGEQLRKAHEALRADREALQASQQTQNEQLRALQTTHQAHQQQLTALQAAHQAQQQQLAGLDQEREQLQDLHGQLTDQASKLAADWNSRRQALTAENQRLATELAEVRQTLVQGQEREKQWKEQVWKLQDDVRTLKGAAGRVTLSAEQAHDLLSQLNAIVGFAEVLLDEAGSRATATERQEFLQHIRDSGGNLAAHVGRLTGQSGDTNLALFAAAGDSAAAQRRPDAPPVLVAAADPELRERVEPFLSRAGYRVEFAGDLATALKMALQQQPLAVMIDIDLPPKGAQGLIDELLFEPRTKDIPVVLTVKNDDEPAGVSLGQYDFLRKPINRQQVLQVMTKYDLLAERRRANKMPTSVLVIDDDPKNTRLVQAMLKPYNIEVLLANDGTSGIKLARARKPDLIILDLMMPEVDGFAVVSALRSDPATERTPILIYTAKNISAADRELLQGNIQSIVRKGDFSKEQFLELVYRRGERRQPRAAAEEAA
ncbi:MAG TPA: response regulator [Candidatus Dormibacteraeota bacterium]|nr:response regulator [Candidatus Dormibacteraeota bacterium]